MSGTDSGAAADGVDADIAIVGAGPAGLACAAEAAALGLSSVLLDDNPRPGGQYLRHPAFATAPEDPLGADARRLASLLAVTALPQVSYRPGATVWDLPAPGVLAVAEGERSGRVRAHAIVLATGAYDRPAPFPGWTLPGVISAGAAQNLLKGMRILPGRRVVVAGNGPLVMLVAANLLACGVEVVAIAEAAPVSRRLWRTLPMLLSQPNLLLQAVRWRHAFWRAGVPFLQGWTIVRATGTDRVDGAVLCPLNPDGTRDERNARSFACDSVVVGYGLLASVELLRLARAALHWEPQRGGFLPVRDAAFRTTVPGVWAVGDGAGIGGARLAEAEGRIAAHAIAATRCHRGDQRRLSDLRARWGRIDQFRRGLEQLFAAPLPPHGPVGDETVICRCEEVTAGMLAAARGAGAESAVQIKAATRLGMGRCQGRNCLPSLSAMVAREQDASPGEVAWPMPRPPARMIPIGALLVESLPPPDLPADPHLPRKRAG